MTTEEIQSIAIILREGAIALFLLAGVRLLYLWGNSITLQEAIKRLTAFATSAEKQVDDRTDLVPTLLAGVLSRAGVKVDSQKVSDLLEQALEAGIVSLQNISSRMKESPDQDPTITTPPPVTPPNPN